MKTARILVVDDEESIRFTFEAFLTEAGYAVDTAENLAQAISLAETHHYDAVFLDILLGRESGMEVLRVCRQVNPHGSVIMVTGAPEIHTAAEAVRLGAFDYVTKPVHQDELLRLARRGLEHKALLDQQEMLRQRMTAVFQSVKEGILVFDQDQCLVDVNEAAREMLRCGDEIIGRQLTDLVSEVSCPVLKALQGLIQARCEGEIFRLEVQNLAGEELALGLSMSPLTSSSGEENGLVLVLRDETMPSRPYATAE